MPRRSAGLLLYRRPSGGAAEVLLVHPGGPLWARRDDGAWSIPKGEYDQGDDPFETARREFQEETGHPVPAGDVLELGTVVQRSGKRVAAWAVMGDLDPATVTSNTFEMEWPPRSGRRQTFPEIDRAAWFTLEEAARKVVEAQRAFLERLAGALA